MTLTAFIDGFIYCKVQHPIRYTLNNIAFDLNHPYYLLMASGPTGDCKKSHEKGITFYKCKLIVAFLFYFEVNIQQHTTDESSSLALTVTNALCIQYFTEPSSNFSKFLHSVVSSFYLFYTAIKEC